MGMVDSPNGNRSAKKGKKRQKRIGFHLDMTPMVDVAFLLLTFLQANLYDKNFLSPMQL